MKIIFEVSPDDLRRSLEAMSVFLVFIVLPPANIQVAIFVIIWWQNGKKVLMIYHQYICVKSRSFIPFGSSFRQ